MSNTDIRLPTSGSLNWGGGLNRYLENLNLEVANLQRLVAQKKENYHLVGYAGSGMVGECKIKYDASSHKVSFSGNVYLSGEYAYYKEGLTVTSETEEESEFESDTSYPLFVYLKADISTDGSDQGEYTWKIVTDDSFQIDYHYILLGLFYRFTVSSASGNKIIENFIPYYFSSAKTLSQHKYELTQRWADLNRNLTSLTVTIKDKIPSILSTDLDWDGDFDLYCGGLGHNNEPITVLNPTGKYTVARSHFVTKSGVQTLEKKNINVILFQDKVEGEEGKIVTSKLESWNINDFSDGKTVYFRVLLDIFGNIIIQKSLDDLVFLSTQRQWSEQQLYNARFASLESSIVSGASGFSWEAGLPIEVARFGYNCADISDTTYKQNDHTPGLANFYFVKSLDAGVAYQQAQNIYITQDSEIWLDKVSFKKIGSDPNNFVIDYKGRENGEYLDKSYTNKITSTTSSFYTDEQVAKSDWKQDIAPYVEEIGWYEVKSGSDDVIKYFKTKKAFDKIKFGRGDVEKEETVYELLEEQKDLGYNFIPLEAELDEGLALNVTFQENIYTISLGVGKKSNKSFSTNWGNVKSQLTAEEFYITITPAEEFNTIYFDFTTSESDLSKVLWTKTNTLESIELSSNGISLISSNDIGLTSSNDINLKSSKYINLTSDNNINLTSDNYGINLTSNNNINLSSRADIVITTEREFVLTTSDNPSDEDKFTIALNKEIPLKIVTSELSLSKNLYVESELNFGTEGFITLPSDRRLKTNIENINHSFLNVVNQTPILSFKYKGGRDTFVGLMAQDLRNSLPEEFKNIFVKTHETEEYKDQLCIAETKLVYVLWKALQEEIKNRNKLEEEIYEIKKHLSL